MKSLALVSSIIIGGVRVALVNAQTPASVVDDGNPATTYLFYRQGPIMHTLPDGTRINLNNVWSYRQDPSNPDRVAASPQGILPMTVEELDALMLVHGQFVVVPAEAGE